MGECPLAVFRKRINHNPNLALRVYHEMKARRPNDSLRIGDLAAQLLFNQIQATAKTGRNT